MKSRFLLLLLLLVCAAGAEQLVFSIRYLGMKVADVVIEDTKGDGGGRLRIEAHSTSLAGALMQLDNIYDSEYRGDYLPDRYYKLVEQKDYRENRVTRYRRNEKLATRTSAVDDARNRTYPIHEEVRDFFTALYYLRHHLEDTRELHLDAAGVPWIASIDLQEVEKIGTGIGKIEAQKIIMTFSRENDKQKERSDMLTNNLVARGCLLYFWFSEDDRRLPVRCSFRMKPFPISWVLEEVNP